MTHQVHLMHEVYQYYENIWKISKVARAQALDVSQGQSPILQRAVVIITLLSTKADYNQSAREV